MSVTTLHSTYWKHHQFVRRKNPNKWKIHLRAEDEFIPPISYHVCSALAVLGSHRGPQLIYTGLYIWYFSEPEWTIWKMSSCVLFGGLIYMEKTIFFFLNVKKNKKRRRRKSLRDCCLHCVSHFEMFNINTHEQKNVKLCVYDIKTALSISEPSILNV